MAENNEKSLERVIQKRPLVKRLEKGFFNTGDVRKKLAMIKILTDAPFTSLRAVAGLLNVSRNTVAAWFRNVEFQRVITEKREAYKLSTRLRREAETTVISDMLAQKVISRLEKGDVTKEASDVTMSLSREYRAFRDEERKDTGEFIGKGFTGGVKQLGAETGVIEGIPTDRQNLVTFIQQNFPNMTVESDNPSKAIVDIGVKLLRDTNIIDAMTAEDVKAQEIIDKAKNKKR